MIPARRPARRTHQLFILKRDEPTEEGESQLGSGRSLAIGPAKRRLDPELAGPLADRPYRGRKRADLRRSAGSTGSCLSSV